jgi:hypothetical protein
MTITIKENSFIAKLAAAKLKSKRVAIVIGSTIHLWNTTKEEFLQDKKWLMHELEHVRQYQKYGVANFIFSYLIESIKHGYQNNKFEKQARESEKNFQLIENIEIKV